MLDHVFITVEDFDRSIAFYKKALKPLGIAHATDFDGKDGPEGHPDLKGFGRDGRIFFWLRQGDPDAKAAHIGFVANSEAGERVLQGRNGRGRDRQRQARRARVLRSPLLRCERFRSRRLQSRGGLQELATPPIIEAQN
jgi:catechol 2,3-dioxygenase-like lactoylglutathione lyase family enzyme